MYLKSRVRNLEKKARQNNPYAFIAASTQEEAEEKLRKYWEENPDGGPIPIVCVVKPIKKGGEKEDKIAIPIPEPGLDAKIEKLLTQVSSRASRDGEDCVRITM